MEQRFDDALLQRPFPRALPKFEACKQQLAAVNVSAFTREGYRLAELTAYQSPATGAPLPLRRRMRRGPAGGQRGPGG